MAHDASTKIFCGYTKIGCVIIGSNVYIGASTIVLPNVKIGDNVIVGAGSLVSRDLPSHGVYCGNPCTQIADYDEWINMQKSRMDTCHLYDTDFTINNITLEKKNQMKNELKDQIGFIK